MLVEIFSYLSISENFRYRSVCKLWDLILNGFRYSQLTILRNSPSQPHKCFDHFEIKFEPVKNAHLIKLHSDQCLANLAKEAVFSNVKEMSTCFSNVNHVYLEHFYNQFVGLENLVVGSNFSSGEDPWCPSKFILLKLKFLKRLNLKTGFFNFFLKTPELLYLKCPGFPCFSGHEAQEKIKFLDMGILKISLFLPKDYVLANLEKLVIRDFFLNLPIWQSLKHF